jgi:sugar phosphate isomerase/epimerase
MTFRDRRSFLKGFAAAALGGAGAALGGALKARDAGATPAPPQSPPSSLPREHDDMQPPFLVSLAQWSLHRALREKRLDPLDFPVVARRDYNIDAVEYVNQFYVGKPGDAEYLRQLRRRCDDHGVTSVLIMCDGEGMLGDPDDAARAKAIDNHRKWLEWAKYLGCHAIRVNADSRGSPEQQHALTVDGLSRLTEIAAKDDLNVIVENHGGLSSNGAWLAGVLRSVNHPRCGALPDFGNFTIGKRADGTLDQYDRYQGVSELMPFAKGVSAKTYDFDERGEETTVDYHRMMNIVYDAGYRKRVGIEFEGERLSEPEGIRATQSLLERIRAGLAQHRGSGAASKP